MYDAALAAIGGLKGAMDIAKGIQATLSKVELAEVRLDLMQRIGEAQVTMLQAVEDLQACRAKNSALEADIAQLKAFDADVENYELKDTGRGALAYRPKDAPEGEEHGHWHCPHCFEQRKKTRMVPNDWGSYGLLSCPSCKLDLHLYGHRPDPARRR